jgi:hypothetical protein
MYYKIVRFYFKGGKRTINARCTLAEAQRHCNDPESSSKTCTSASAKAVTRRMGPWFDGYQKVTK